MAISGWAQPPQPSVFTPPSRFIRAAVITCNAEGTCNAEACLPFLLSSCWQCYCHPHFTPWLLTPATLWVPGVAGGIVRVVGRDQVGISSWSSCLPAHLSLVATVHAALTAWHRREELSPQDSAHPRTSLCDQMLFCLINFYLSSQRNVICLWRDWGL